MENPQQITGRVAAIIDDTTLVLSVGSDNGVCEGQWFAIVSAHDEVFDPDTGDSLGQWESVKGRVVVTHVQAHMATVRSPLAVASHDNRGTLSEMMVRHSFGLYGDRDREREPMDVRGVSVAGRPRTQPIAVGDTARSVSLEGVVEKLVESGAGLSHAKAVADRPSTAYASTPSAEGEDGA
jgi:hypothetical protein